MAYHQEKVRIIAVISFISSLLGCSSLQSNAISTSNLNNAISPVDLMQPEDQKRLTQFIATANPHQIISWHNAGLSYEATSRSIFLNKQGQPCRNYQIIVTVRNTHHAWTLTSCRSHGIWTM